MGALERVHVVDASVRAHDASLEACGECALPMSAGKVVELTLRSTRPAQVRARLHPVCAVRFLDGPSVDMGFARQA